MTSLRSRAILGGGLWTLMSMTVGAIALLTIFDGIANRRFDSLLLERHQQVITALANSAGDPALMDVLLTDPGYARPYSGRYWQVEGAGGRQVTSRSLFDTALQVPDASGKPEFWSGPGPEGDVRGLRQLIVFDFGETWTVSVADTLSTLTAERREMAKSVVLTFGLVGGLGLAGGFLLIAGIVRPLTQLRKDVAARWDAGKALEVDDYPTEVAPLVVDINELLERNRGILDRARRQTADLAHALKTPTAALRNEIEGLGETGVEVDGALSALDRVDSQIARSLARMRLAQGASAAPFKSDLARSAERLSRLFRSMPKTSSTEMTVDIPSGLGVAMDAQDLEEVLGNALENAFKWGRSAVRLAARELGDKVVATIEDDGPGIPEHQHLAALQAGGRLDSAVPGTGLGLAIASDLIEAYGGSITLGASEELGGLRVTLTAPRAALAHP
jgi:signal transduction histidine kinase